MKLCLSTVTIDPRAIKMVASIPPNPEHPTTKTIIVLDGVQRPQFVEETREEVEEFLDRMGLLRDLED
jgi:hypothetical protein